MSAPRKNGNGSNKYWTKPRIRSAIKKWEDIFGRPPTEADWNVARAKGLQAGSQARVDSWQERIEEYQTGNYPSSDVLKNTYGKWSEGIVDAGYVPLPQGKPSRKILAKYMKRKDRVDEAALLLAIEDVKSTLDHGSRMDKWQALMDLAQTAATLAEELKQ